jgi:peptide/nickel transport system substrate-binding protein
MFRIRSAGTLGFLALAALAAGCGQVSMGKTAFHDTNPLPQDTMTFRTDELGTYGGRFIIGQTSSPKTFNALMANESSSSDVTQRMFAGMTDYDNSTQQDMPGIAKSWEVSPDGLTWTWHLRRGAKFSDGHPITSEDVLFTYQLAYDEKLHPSWQDLMKPGGKPVEASAPDSYTVVTKLAAPYAMTVSTIGGVPIMPKHMLKAAYDKGDFAAAYNAATAPDSIVTSGPWRVKQFVAGEKTVLERNPWYYGVDAAGHRLPYLDELVFLIVPDQEAAALKFHAGELDGLDDVKPEDYQSYADKQQKENFTLYDLGPSLNTQILWFNLNTVKEAKAGKKVGAPEVAAEKYAWFKQADFRRAVSKAIDRDAMIKSALFGEGVKNWESSTPANKQWYNPSITGDDYDVEGAKKLLAGLGYKDKNGDGVLEDAQGHDISFTLKTNASNKFRVQMANFIKDDLAKVGIKCTPVPLEFNSLISNLREDFQYEAMLLGLQSGVPPDPGMGQNVWLSSGPTHYWNVKQKHPETPQEAQIDKLVEAMVSTNDMTKRKEDWDSIQKAVNAQTFFIWLPTPKIKVPVRNGFGNVQPVIIPHRILWNIDRVFVKPHGQRT